MELFTYCTLHVNVLFCLPEPGKHILLLFAKWESSIGEKDRLTSQISEAEQQYKLELERLRATSEEDMDNKVKDAIERTRLEGKTGTCFGGGHLSVTQFMKVQYTES